MDTWLALVGLSLGVLGALPRTRRRRLPRQESALTIALTVAALEATRRGHAEVVPAHVAYAAVFALEQPGGPDLSAVREQIDAELEALPVTAPPDAGQAREPLGQHVRRAVRRAAAKADTELRSLSLDDVLGALQGEPSVDALLDAAHKPPPSTPSPDSGAPYRTTRSATDARVVLLNDDVSTMEGVLEVLRECFSKGHAEALHLMLTTHYAGRAIVGHYAWDEAEARRRAATARARGIGMPLAILVLGDGEREDPDAPGLGERLLRFFSPRPSP